MHVQVNTDNHTTGSADFIQKVEVIVETALSRFESRITRVEVHLTDENSSSKSRENDKRCVMEARLAGLQPITVSADGSSLEQALNEAAGKLKKTLSRTLDRLDDHKGQTSFAGDQTL
jgi:Sigma 54 modulation protein / S30EA ribosomal protein.